MNVPVITIDGPSGSGKSELCKQLSKKLNWNFLQSGLLYRILALHVLKNQYCIKKNINILLKSLNFFEIINKNISNKENSNSNILNVINKEEIGNFASKLASFSYVRKYLLIKQKMFRQFPGLVADGRDMGTIVFPDACMKFFLQASLKVRTKRRLLDLQNTTKINFDQLLIIMKERDYRDINRSISPLFPSKDSIIIDSTYMNMSQVLDICIKHITTLKNVTIFNI